MSTTASTPVRHRFFVYAPDKTEPGTLERRLSVREKHLVGAKVNHESGLIRKYKGANILRSFSQSSLQALEA